MNFQLLITLLFSTTSGVIASPDEIPWVKSVVSSMTKQFESCVNYIGPTGTATLALKTHSVTKVTATPTATSYWLEEIKHQGIAAFNPDPSTYVVFRNVKDFGAVGEYLQSHELLHLLTPSGDGITDDTIAINNAISSGGRCGPGTCSSSTTTPAVVYFPAGTYLISSSIIDYYYTQIIGNPNSLPTLKATANFSGFGLIDGDLYGADGLGFGDTNVFYRQVRNLIFDLTAIPSTSSATGIHWPTAQATSLQNCVFLMSDAPGTQHEGIFIEDGESIVSFKEPSKRTELTVLLVS